MFKISEFSELTTISPRMLRHYDKLNLLKPALTQYENNYRFYTPEQINVANRILSLKNIGIPLKDIKAILDGTVDQTDYLIHHRKRIETELAEKKLHLAYLDLLEEKNSSSEVEAINYPIETKIMHETLVLGHREIVDSYYEEEQLWQTLFAEIRTQDFPHLGQSIALFHHDTSDFIEIEVLIGLPETLQSLYPKAKLFSPGLVASVVVSGAYTSIPQVHTDMAKWLKLNGYVLSGNLFNLYHSSPATEEREELYITEICYPIKRADYFYS